MISVEEALARLLAPLEALPAEQVSISDAVGRYELDGLSRGGAYVAFAVGGLGCAVAATAVWLDPIPVTASDSATTRPAIRALLIRSVPPLIPLLVLR